MDNTVEVAKDFIKDIDEIIEEGWSEDRDYLAEQFVKYASLIDNKMITKDCQALDFKNCEYWQNTLYGCSSCYHWHKFETNSKFNYNIT